MPQSVLVPQKDYFLGTTVYVPSKSPQKAKQKEFIQVITRPVARTPVADL